MGSYEKVIQEAIKARILEDLKAKQAAAQVINNFQGGGGGGGSIQDRMASSAAPEVDPGDFDYYVDIDKNDIPGEGGKPIGWQKKVHRYRHPKGEEPKKKVT